jgi:Domain of unknown function (DUF1906)
MQRMPENTIAFDACVPLDRYIGGLAAAGFNTVGRYVAPGAANAWKIMTPAEAVALAIAGIKVFPIYETNGRPNGAAVGASDGKFAVSYLPKIGLMPSTGVVVMYAEDKDTSAAEMPGVAAAFEAFGKQLPGYGIGSYGGGYCNAQLAARGLITVKWLTQSMGFNGSRAAAAAGDFDMIQRLPADVRINGSVINIDPDSLLSATTDIGARVPWNGAVPWNAPLSIVSIQLLLDKAGQSLDVDDVSGSVTKGAIAAFLAKHGFTKLDWSGAIPQLLADAGVAIYGAHAGA